MTILTFNPFEREPSWITRLTYNRALRCFEFIPRRISTTRACLAGPIVFGDNRGVWAVAPRWYQRTSTVSNFHPGHPLV